MEVSFLFHGHLVLQLFSGEVAEIHTADVGFGFSIVQF